MLDPHQLVALAAIHRRGSFELAASDLGVTPSAISQRLKGLEDQVGSLLIIRGQPCHATPTGLRLIAHFDQISLMESQLAAELPGLPKGPRPRLRIALNADSLATWIVPALKACPDHLFDLVIDDQDVSQDWLRRGEVIAAVTANPKPPQGCDSLALGALRYRATASPGFIAHWFAEGLTPQALQLAPMLEYDAKDRLQSRWLAAQGGAGLHPPAHRLPSTHAFIDAARAGLGWGMNPEVLARPHLHSGALVELLPGSPLDTPLFWQFPRLAEKGLEPLTGALKRAAKQALIP
jgi:LysR family transcriptional regulator (chromosome initiation inhibitor)